eukprot:gene2819-biopygen11687
MADLPFRDLPDSSILQTHTRFCATGIRQPSPMSSHRSVSCSFEDILSSDLRRWRSRTANNTRHDTPDTTTQVDGIVESDYEGMISLVIRHVRVSIAACNFL